jgi:hypothetical protein
MKKITSLLFAGIVAMAFAAVADAGTVNRIEAPVDNNIVRTVYVQDRNVNSGGVDYGYASSFASVNQGKMDDYRAAMVAAGWNASTSIVWGENNYRERTDTFTRSEDNIIGVSSSSEISYAMVDGVLRQVVNNVVTITRQITNYTSTSTGSGEPITLDTTNTGKITTARHEWLRHSPAFYPEFASKFDFTGDGIPDNCEWVSDNPDALLCMPVKGQINGVTELFGDLGGYANGFDKLSVLCDKDGNGVVEGKELDGLMLWVDSNRNGIADAGELKTLDSYGITKFYTDHKNFVGKYETSDGQTHTMWAWFPSLNQ